jgi:hypothetical protein
VLLGGIALLGLRSRRLARRPEGESLSRLRRTSTIELVLAAGAIALAAILGSLAPPASGRLTAPLGLTVTGTDAHSAMRVQLDAASADPGPNRFVLHAVGYASRKPIPIGHVTLRFTPLDDPGDASTSLELRPSPGYAFAGSGANMVFDGRWGVVVSLQRPSGIVRVPLELDTRSPAQFVSIERIPGEAPKYTAQVGNVGYVRISPHPERAGPSKIYVTCYDVFSDVSQARELVITASAGNGPTRQLPARRAGTDFIASVELQPGKNTIAVVATTTDGRRLRASVDLDVPH